jgi:hypothetical protein
MKRTLWLLVAVALLLLAGTYLVLQRPGERNVTGASGDLLVQYDSAAVDRMIISQPSGTVSLERDGGAWFVNGDRRFAADPALIATAIGRGKGIALKSLISSNPSKQSLFQVDSSGALVRVFERGEERAVFRIGKAGPSFTETYVRLESSNDVYLADGLFTYEFTRKPNEWRDHTILRILPDAVTRIAFRYGDTTVAIQRSDSVWFVDGTRAQERPIRLFLAACAGLAADDFIDTALAAFPPVRAQIDIDGTSLRFYGIEGAPTFIVQSSGAAQLFTVHAWRTQQLFLRKKDVTAG